MPEVVESYLMSKSGHESGGEDRLVQVDGRFYGVVDGATDRTGLNWGTDDVHISGGQCLADILKSVFSSAEADVTPETLATTINTAIHEAALRANIDLTQVNNRADVAFAVYSVARNEVLHIHDCAFGLLLEDGQFVTHYHDKAVDRFTSELRAALVKTLQSHGIDPFPADGDIGRKFIQPLLKRQPELQNGSTDDDTPWAFGLPRGLFVYKTLNGMPTSIDHTPVPPRTQEIVLASDGFRTLLPTLKETQSGHEFQLKSDPHCIGALKSTKGLVPGNLSYDDMSYVRVRL